MNDVDRRSLQRELRRALQGEVRFDTATRALYATDASNYRQPPIGVVIPKTIDDVVATHAVCHEHGAPITARGCGTSLSGETVNFSVIVDCSKYLTRIDEPDLERRRISVQPGAINERVNERTGRHGIIFAPDPSTHAYCTIGGNVGNNSCGAHSVQAQFYGEGARTSDNVHSLDVLTYDGRRLHAQRGTSGDERIDAQLHELVDRYADLIRARFPQIPRRVSGFNLDDLLPERGFHVARALVGTEGTCVTVLEATLCLVEDPPAKCAVVLGYPDVADAGDHVGAALSHRPLAVEGFDDKLVEWEREASRNVEALKLLPEGKGWMYVEVGGSSPEEAQERAQAVLDELGGDALDARLVRDDAERKQLNQVREVGLAIAAFPRGRDHWEGWEDSAVPPERIGGYLRDLRALAGQHGYSGTFYGHLGQGCMHIRYDFDLRTAAGIARYRAFVEDAADLVVSYGGSLSGEHGDGQARAELLPRMYGHELVQAFREFKAIWDPHAKMNPGKVVDPFRLDEHLKLARPVAHPRVEFAYPKDHGDFAHATVRCVGVGRCRKPDGFDVMCPSFVATHEEMHTTRGRARLLHEMLDGELVDDGWRSAEVLESLDLCLACKGCTKDCPVEVDMPTYKAEFLHHHYDGRLRPRHAYAFGLIDKAARFASLEPELVNLLLRTPGLARAAKAAAGMAPQRRFPRFAPLTLRAWFRARGERNTGGPRVLLWADTFNNYFHAGVGVAAVEALEASGYHVVLPRARACCGRPLYDYGMLDLARRYLRRTLDVLRDELRAGTPVVGIEPSCVAVFKDELLNLFPGDPDARALAASTHHFAELLVDREVPPLRRRALLWGHCHHKATGGLAPDRKVLERMGLEVEEASGGCCGLAGSWGFEAEHYELSQRIGEHAFLPRVRTAGDDVVIVTNGFSCKTQVEQLTNRRALHLAEALQLARAAGPDGPTSGRPEASAAAPPSPSAARRALRAAAVAVPAAGYLAARRR